MKDYTHGWQKAIDAVNPKIKNGVASEKESDVTQSPAKPEPEAPDRPLTEADSRDAAIEAFCGKIGVPMGIARKYRFDIRPLHRITNDILKRSVESRAVARGGSWIR